MYVDIVKSSLWQICRIEQVAEQTGVVAGKIPAMMVVPVVMRAIVAEMLPVHIKKQAKAVFQHDLIPHPRGYKLAAKATSKSGVTR